MLAIEILMVLCFGFQNISKSTNQEKPAKLSVSLNPDLSKSRFDDSINYANTVYVKELKYIRDGKFNKLAKITFKNTTKHVISTISFNLKGNIHKEYNNCYEIKRKIKLKPNRSVSIFQLLNVGDGEEHTIENLKVRYAIDVSFTLD